MADGGDSGDGHRMFIDRQNKNQNQQNQPTTPNQLNLQNQIAQQSNALQRNIPNSAGNPLKDIMLMQRQPGYAKAAADPENIKRARFGLNQTNTPQDKEVSKNTRSVKKFKSVWAAASPVNQEASDNANSLSQSVKKTNEDGKKEVLSPSPQTEQKDSQNELKPQVASEKLTEGVDKANTTEEKPIRSILDKYSDLPRLANTLKRNISNNPQLIHSILEVSEPRGRTKIVDSLMEQLSDADLKRADKNLLKEMKLVLESSSSSSDKNVDNYYAERLDRFIHVDKLKQGNSQQEVYEDISNDSKGDIKGIPSLIVTEPRKFDGKMRSPDFINSKLKNFYNEVLKENYIIKGKDGIHRFDSHRANNELIDLFNVDRQAALEQFKDLKSEANQVLKKYDTLLFNGQDRKEKEKNAQREEAFKIAFQKEQKLLKYKQDARKGKDGAILQIAGGSLGALFSAASISTSAKSFFTENMVALAGLAFSLDQISGGYETLEAIEEGIFQSDKEYKIVKGFLIENLGDEAGLVYDITAVGFSLSSIKENITGENLNELVRAGSLTIDAINVYTAFSDIKK
ncbi:hypothetical protein [Reichenbachiella versicolor]|uniref:hypothetical protein n=1 Tax=Reichenbachiella versicolor TaxID=1821036 RepID=UPI0013A573E3|nr:hypothetical protein [Reichenbachiella versicolor]